MRRVAARGTRLLSTTRTDAHSIKPKHPPSLSERLRASNQPLIASSRLALLHTQQESSDVLKFLSEAIESPPSDDIPSWRPHELQDEWGPDLLVPDAKIRDPNNRESPPHVVGKASKSKAKAEPPKPKPKTKTKFPAPASKRPVVKKKKDKRDKKAALALDPSTTEGLIEPSDGPVLVDVPPLGEQRPVATLAHGLDRVLFNSGVHWLQDPRSRVYNFTPYLEDIPKVTNFAFEKLVGFIKSSHDEDLRTLARQEGRTFTGSTSSLSGMLSHCYFLISDHRPVDISSLSMAFKDEPKNFTPGQRMPAAVTFNYKDGIYSIDADGDDSSKNVLTWMGHLLEKFLTTPEDEFKLFLRSEALKAENPDAETEDPIREAYRYSKSEKFVMRSQLDCVDPRLPGTGVFDIKTRAALPVRMDIMNWEENSGYVLKSAQGLYESFEREYYDLIRSAFLKYGFQVRIGNMDGVIVAYHNTAKAFGFQYVPLEEMDRCLFGTEPTAGDRVFQKCVGLLEAIAPEVVKCFPEQSVKVLFECEEDSPQLNIFVQPLNWTSETDEPAPIHQLVVRVQNYLDDTAVSGTRAINSISSFPWTLHWTLTRQSEDQEEIRRNYTTCMDHKFRAWSIPTGVSHETLPEFWRSLNFGAPADAPVDPVVDGQLPVGFDRNRFRSPDVKVQMLRDLSRSGRRFTEMMSRLDARRKKIVLGQEFELEDLEYAVMEEVKQLESEIGADLDESGSDEDASAGVDVEEEVEEVDIETAVADVDYERLQKKIGRTHRSRRKSLLAMLDHLKNAKQPPL
ncbi:hypothetical protein MKEN_00892200 [Mycena kentingensis (nom. inval.)]|nr:hypothetical protein MKEN_00892200 [Mycena kentingensis (nom. inval.)]